MTRGSCMSAFYQFFSHGSSFDRPWHRRSLLPHYRGPLQPMHLARAALLACLRMGTIATSGHRRDRVPTIGSLRPAMAVVYIQFESTQIRGYNEREWIDTRSLGAIKPRWWRGRRNVPLSHWIANHAYKKDGYKTPRFLGSPYNRFSSRLYKSIFRNHAILG